MGTGVHAAGPAFRGLMQENRDCEFEAKIFHRKKKKQNYRFSDSEDHYLKMHVIS